MVVWLGGWKAARMEVHSVEKLAEQRGKHLVGLWGLRLAEMKVGRKVGH
jgi:hypothetical protein